MKIRNSLAATVTLLIAAAGTASAAPSGAVEVQILALNDFHGNLQPPSGSSGRVGTVDAGGADKQIVAGIKRGYAKEELVGKFVILVDNLAPAMLRGVESQGMLLAASDQESIAVLSPDKPMKPGSIVK